MKRLGFIALLLAGAAALGAGAHAQQISRPNRARARAEFERGVIEMDANRWRQARAHFETAYALTRHPSILLNLAQAQRQTEQWVEAERSYTEYVRRARPGDPMVADAREVLSQLRDQIPRISIVSQQFQAGDQVRVDTQVLQAGALSEVRLNPGVHTIVVVRNGRDVAHQTVRLAAGEVHPVVLSPGSVTLAPTDGALNPGTTSNVDWGWVAFGIIAGALLIGGAITIALVLTAPQPFVGNIGSGQLSP